MFPKEQPSHLLPKHDEPLWQRTLAEAPSSEPAQAAVPSEPLAPGGQSLVPPRLRWVALAVGSALFAGGFVLPVEWQPYAAAAGSVAYFLAGLGWRMPAWAPRKPLLSLTLVPLALTASRYVEQLQPLLSDTQRPFLALVSGLLALGGGTMLPDPKLPTTPSLSTSPRT